ncbi:MAG: cation transporter [Bacteroidales bacterium]|nr:cation transporter [Bacteroidales bacterium]
MEHHQHHYHKDISGKNLLISSVLNLSITIVEIIGGLVSNSLALLSDALHNLGDTFAVFIAWMAHLISKKDYTDKKTFGYKRIEILAALFNAIVLIVITFFLFTEAFKRLSNPEPVMGQVMFVVAVAGLLANIISVFLLRRDSRHNINVKAAYLHLLGDTISSVAVIIGAVFIYFFGWYWLDPVITVIVGLYILKETWTVLKQALGILMQGTPRELELTEVKQALEILPEIDNIHHVHAWNLNDNEIHFECHIDLKEDIRISQTEKIKEKIHEILLNKFGISHVTIQYEFNCCDNKEMIHSR